MLITYQIPFVDYRPFYSDGGGKTQRPSWPTPLDWEYIRRFGSVRSRLFHSSPAVVRIQPAPHERFYVDSHRCLRQKSFYVRVGSENVKVTPVFFRTLSSQFGCIRFEIGFYAPSKLRIFHDKKYVQDFIRAILNSNSGQTLDKNKNNIRYKYLAPLLRTVFIRATTKHHSNGKQRAIASLIKPLRPQLCVVFDKDIKLRWLSRGDQVLRSLPCRLSRFEEGDCDQKRTTWLFGEIENQETEVVRLIRLHILRYSAEAQVFLHIVNLSRDERSLNILGVDQDRVEAFFRSSIDRFRDKIAQIKNDWLLDPNSIFRSAIGEDETQLLDSLIDEAKNDIHRWEKKRLTEKKMSTKIIIEKNEGDIYTGDNPQVTKINIQSIDCKDLAEQLGTLHTYIAALGKSDDQITSLKAISAAKDAALKGDKSKALVWLCKAGKWTLNQATAISVPVVVAAIKLGLGLSP